MPPINPSTPATPTAKPCNGAPYPIILAHGFAGFQKIGPINYFFQVAPDLRSRGEVVIEAEVDPYAAVTARAAELAKIIDQTRSSTGACKVNLIAHSQGGLDSRYVISSLGYADRIAALITVASPHHGTPLADIALGLVPGYSYAIIDALLKAVQGLTSDATGAADLKPCLVSLSTRAMGAFNTQNPDDPRVSYFSIAGRSALRLGTQECSGSLWPNPQRLDPIDPLLVLPESIIASTGPLLQPVVNDGIVPTASARWGQFLGCVPANHFEEIGQIAEVIPDPISGFDHKQMYRDLASLLHGHGF